MGILDKFKKKKGTAAPADKELAVTPAMSKEAATEKEAVMTPDGKLVTVEKKKTDKKKETKAKPKKEETGEAYHVLVKPLVTEKGSWLGANNQYLFEVAPRTNKVEVTKAIKKVYGVDPIKVNIMNVRGRYVRYGRTEGATKGWKKAVVTLPQGQKIEIQEGL